MKKVTLTAMCLLAMATVAQANRQVLADIGYANAAPLSEVPATLRGTMISIALIQQEGDPIINEAGERVGKVSTDTIELFNNLHPITSMWAGTHSTWGMTVILFSPEMVFFFSDTPEDVPGRFRLEVLLLEKGRSVVFILK